MAIGNRAAEAFELANSSRHEGNCEEAIRQYTEAIELGISNIYLNLALYYRAVCRLSLGYEDKAIVDLEECEKRGGIDDAILYNSLGVCLLRLGRLVEAKVALEKGLERKEKHRNGELLSNLGYVYEALGQLEDAAASFWGAMDHDYFDCTEDFCRAVISKADLNQSIKLLGGIIQELGKNMPASKLADVHFWIGTCMFNIENMNENPNYNQAIAEFELAANDASNLARSVRSRGMANLFADNFKAAINDFTDIIEANCGAEEERDANDYYYRAKALAGADQYLSSLKDIEVAISLNDQSGQYFFLKGCLLHKIQREAHACEAWKAAIDLGHKQALDFFESYGCSQVLDSGKRSEDLTSHGASSSNNLNDEKSEQLKAFIAAISEDDDLQECLEWASSVISVVRIAKRHGFIITPAELLAASPISFFVTNKEGIRHFIIDVR